MNSVRIAVHATASARHNQVCGSHDGALRVSVTAVADKGRANKAIIQALANSLGLRKSQLKLVSGSTNRRKVFEITDPSIDLEDRLTKLRDA